MNSHPKAPSKAEALLALEAIESWASSPALEGVRRFIEATPEPSSQAPAVPDGWQLVPVSELLRIARLLEGLKQECGDDPESPTAIRNGSLMTVSLILRSFAAAPQPPLAQETAPRGWRNVIAEARSGLAAGNRSISATDFEIEYGGALLDHIEEKLEALAAAKQEAAELDATRYRWLRDKSHDELVAALKDVLRIAKAASLGVSGNKPRIAKAEAALANATRRTTP